MSRRTTDPQGSIGNIKRESHSRAKSGDYSTRNGGLLSTENVAADSVAKGPHVGESETKRATTGDKYRPRQQHDNQIKDGEVAARRTRTVSSSSTDSVGRRGETPGSSERESGFHSEYPKELVLDRVSSVEENGGKKDHRAAHHRQDSRVDPNAPPRLLVVSSKIKNSMILQTAVLPNVTFIQYKFESATLEGVLGSISQHLGSKKVECMAFIFPGSTTNLNVTGKDDKAITKGSIAEQPGLRDFFINLVDQHLDKAQPNARLDFLACPAAQTGDGPQIVREIGSLVGLTVGISRDVTGTDIPYERVGEESCAKPLCVGELYFRLDRLRSWTGHNQQTLAGFEKIRTVGKGAYGTAVLYQKKDDDSLVILKEINLHDLNASERQLALNEVRVLAMLDHPNIISYYDSFEEDGIVMIEMEYADGGTLAQYLAEQDKPMEEREILEMFAQIVSAIKYIHEHHILHRDLKTANIFLTKEGCVKMGDFGISKLMSTANQGANTVLGTPYYISPEMCEGKPYNNKSDIWALGCILYEMACLQKTFEGSNLPALVNKIMKGQFAPVKGNYSHEFKNLVMDMLQREPEYRPSAAELWQSRLIDLLPKNEEESVTDYDDEMLQAENPVDRNRKTRSVLYYFEMASMLLTPISLPSKIKIRNVAVGGDHVIVVTVERMVYTYGEGNKGQLGHGDLESRSSCELVEALKGKSIVRACCGEGFSVFASDNGIVMTCGDGTAGCLGHGDWCSTSRPRLIEALLSVDVTRIGSGSHHVVAVGSDGEVFTWGRGADGRLGLGPEDNQCQPTEVPLTDQTVCVRDCRCGRDGTMLLTDVGSVLACGNNEYNKLGLNQRVGFLLSMRNIFNKSEVAGEKTFTVVKSLARHRVIDVSMGPTHTAVIVESGHVFMLGRNTEGQLGNGNTKPQNAPVEVKTVEAVRVQCGEYYSVAGTLANNLLIWGTRFKKPQVRADSRGSQQDMRVQSASSTRSHSRQPSTASIGSLNENSSEVGREEVASGATAGASPDNAEECPGGGAVPSPSPSGVPASHQPPGGATDKQASANDSLLVSGPRDTEQANPPSTGTTFRATTGGFRPLSSTPSRTPSANAVGSRGDKDAPSKDETETILQPTPLISEDLSRQLDLWMDSSGSHSHAGDTVTLSRFLCHGENLFIQVETTAPPPKRRARRKRRRFQTESLEVPGGSHRMSASSRDGGDEYSSEASELDTFGTIPPWLKHELANSEMEEIDGNEADDTSDHSDEDATASPTRAASMSNMKINEDLKPPAGPRVKPQRAEYSHGGNASFKSSKVMPMYTVGKQTSAAATLSLDGPPSEPLSSSSSLENLRDHQQNKDDKSKAGALKKPPPMGPPKRAVAAAAPVPLKSKAGPIQGQKPLTRIRAQGKTRRSDPNDPISAKGMEADVKNKQDNLSKLQVELDRLRDENREKEERLQKLEEQHQRKQDSVRKEAQKKASDNEDQLKGEIHHLRQELHQQSSQMKENYGIVLSLQEQLLKVQTEQVRLSTQEAQRGRSESRQSTQKESRICALQ